MVRFLKNCTSLLVNLIGLITIVGGIYLVSLHLCTLWRPWHEPAHRALYYYDHGEASNLLNGSVDLLIDKGYHIQKVEAHGSVWPQCGAPPSIQFYRQDGTEITHSRLSYLWTMYDVMRRFGRM